MKIALELNGLIRQADICWPSLQQNLIKNHNCDIFISTWKADLRSLVKPQPGDNCSLSKVLELYQPKLYNCEIYNEETKKKFAEQHRLEDFWNIIRKSKIKRRTNGRWARHQNKCKTCGHIGAGGLEKCRTCGGPLINNGIGFFYSAYKASQLRRQYELDNNITYDLVIRSRLDNLFLEEVNLQTDGVYIAAGYDNFIEFSPPPIIGYNDQIMWGPPETMSLITKDIWQNLHEHWLKCFNLGGDPYPHNVIWASVDKLNIEIKRQTIKYVIYRKLSKYRTFLENLTNENFVDTLNKNAI